MNQTRLLQLICQMLAIFSSMKISVILKSYLLCVPGWQTLYVALAPKCMALALECAKLMLMCRSTAFTTMSRFESLCREINLLPMRRTAKPNEREAMPNLLQSKRGREKATRARRCGDSCLA
jgi:hypothetical protein